MQKVSVIQKPVVINANTYRLDFVHINGTDFEIVDLEETDEIVRIYFANTDKPLSEWNDEPFMIQQSKRIIFNRLAKEDAFKGWADWRAWLELTRFEKIERLKPEFLDFALQNMQAV